MQSGPTGRLMYTVLHFMQLTDRQNNGGPASSACLLAVLLMKVQFTDQKNIESKTKITKRPRDFRCFFQSY